MCSKRTARGFLFPRAVSFFGKACLPQRAGVTTPLQHRLAGIAIILAFPLALSARPSRLWCFWQVRLGGSVS
jgi:hypothetical protein